MAAIAGLLVTGVGGLNTAALAGTGGHADQLAAAPPAADRPAADRPADARPGLRSAGGPIVAFRVDVSHYPKVGVVVTVPGGQQRTRPAQFRRPDRSPVRLAGRPPAFGPQHAAGAGPGHCPGPARRREEQAAAARFLVACPMVRRPPWWTRPRRVRWPTASPVTPPPPWPDWPDFCPGRWARRPGWLRHFPRFRRRPGPAHGGTGRRVAVATGRGHGGPLPRAARGQRYRTLCPRRHAARRSFAMTLWPRSAGAGPSGCGRRSSGLARSAGSSVTSASSTTCALPIPIRCPGG